MTQVRIAAIVEGHGEVEAVPVLLRRIALDVDPSMVVEIRSLIRVPADRLKKDGELERTVDLAVRKLEGRGGVFILIDCDWDGGCPKHDGPTLFARARAARPDVPVSVVLAYREFEAWFIAAAESLRGKCRLPEDLPVVADPQGIRGAKEWLSGRMPANQPYAETIDQPAFAAEFDMQSARRADSFDKCYREIASLLGRLREEVINGAG
ncbi:MAG: DUF4276 family protein [Chloroflexi bacterium]|nr:DUF4276 family protein [Chloroflexota bacterium]